MSRGFGAMSSPPPNCDPFWSAQNQGCSDEFGNYIDTQTGQPIQSSDLSRLLQGIQNAITPKPPVPQPTPAGEQPPGSEKPPFDLATWFKTDYNMVYVALGFVLLVVLFKALSSGGRR
jgi:hypothetical protein